MRLMEACRIGTYLRKWGCEYFVANQNMTTGVTAAAILSGAKVRLGWTGERHLHSPTTRIFTHCVIKERLHALHFVECYADTLSWVLGRTLEVGKLLSWIRPETIDQACTGLRPSGPYVVLNLGTGGSNVALPASKYLDIAEGLHQAGYVVVLTGQDSNPSGYSCLTSDARFHSLFACTTLPALAGIVQRADAVVSVDCGTIHLAAAYGTPSVVIYPKLVHPARRFKPWMVPSRSIVPSAYCDGCELVRCSEETQYACAQNIAPSDVIAAVIDLIDERATFPSPGIENLKSARAHE